MLGSGHEPGARIARNTRLRPLFERGYQGILRELLGKTDVSHDSRESCDEPRRLDSPDGIYGTVSLTGWHFYRSHHPSITRCNIQGLVLPERPGTSASAANT